MHRAKYQTFVLLIPFFNVLVGWQDGRLARILELFLDTFSDFDFEPQSEAVVDDSKQEQQRRPEQTKSPGSGIDTTAKTSASRGAMKSGKEQSGAEVAVYGAPEGAAESSTAASDPSLIARRPLRVQDTQGHPSSFVLHIALRLRLLTCPNSPDSSDTPSSSSELQGAADHVTPGVGASSATAAQLAENISGQGVDGLLLAMQHGSSGTGTGGGGGVDETGREQNPFELLATVGVSVSALLQKDAQIPTTATHPNASAPNDQEQAQARSAAQPSAPALFMACLQVLSVLCRWPHNFAVLKLNLGPQWAQFLAQLMAHMTEQLEGSLTALHDFHANSLGTSGSNSVVGRKGSSTGSTADSSEVVSTEEGADGVGGLGLGQHGAVHARPVQLLVRGLLGLVQSFSHCSPEISSVTHDPLPQQPWSRAELLQLGLSLYGGPAVAAASTLGGPTAAARGSAAAVAAGGPGPGGLAGKVGPLQYRATDCSASKGKAQPVASTVEKWLKADFLQELIECGAVNSVVQLLQVLQSFLSVRLASLFERIQEVASQLQSIDNSDSSSSSSSSPSKWSGLGHQESTHAPAVDSSHESHAAARWARLQSAEEKLKMLANGCIVLQAEGLVTLCSYLGSSQTLHASMVGNWSMLFLNSVLTHSLPEAAFVVSASGNVTSSSSGCSSESSSGSSKGRDSSRMSREARVLDLLLVRRGMLCLRVNYILSIRSGTSPTPPALSATPEKAAAAQQAPKAARSTKTSKPAKNTSEQKPGGGSGGETAAAAATTSEGVSAATDWSPPPKSMTLPNKVTRDHIVLSSAGAGRDSTAVAGVGIDGTPERSTLWQAPDLVAAPAARTTTLSVSSIAQFLAWVIRIFDRWDNYADSLRGELDSADSALELAAEFLPEFIAPTARVDVWPWEGHGSSSSRAPANVGRHRSVSGEESFSQRTDSMQQAAALASAYAVGTSGGSIGGAGVGGTRNSNAAEAADFIAELNAVSNAYRLLSDASTQKLKGTMRTLSGYVVWDGIFIELLGSRSLTETVSASSARSRSSLTRPARISQDHIVFIFAIFDHLFEQEYPLYLSEQQQQQGQQPGPGGELSEDCADVLSHDRLPICQLKFVEYISQLFKAAQAEDIFAIIKQFRVLHLLFGEFFLLSHPDLASHMGGPTLTPSTSPGQSSTAAKDFSAGNGPDAAPVPSTTIGGVGGGDMANPRDPQMFSSVEDRRTKDGFVRRTWKQLSCARHGHIYFWLLLHDFILDFMNGLVIYSLYFQSSADAVDSYIGYEDILFILVEFACSASPTVPSKIVFQIIRLIQNLDEIIASIGATEQKFLGNKIMVRLLDLAEAQCRADGLLGLEPSSVLSGTGSAPQTNHSTPTSTPHRSRAESQARIRSGTLASDDSDRVWGSSFARSASTDCDDPQQLSSSGGISGKGGDGITAAANPLAQSDVFNWLAQSAVISLILQRSSLIAGGAGTAAYNPPPPPAQNSAAKHADAANSSSAASVSSGSSSGSGFPAAFAAASAAPASGSKATRSLSGSKVIPAFDRVEAADWADIFIQGCVHAASSSATDSSKQPSPGTPADPSTPARAGDKRNPHISASVDISRVPQSMKLSLKLPPQGQSPGSLSRTAASPLARASLKFASSQSLLDVQSLLDAVADLDDDNSSSSNTAARGSERSRLYSYSSSINPNSTTTSSSSMMGNTNRGMSSTASRAASKSLRAALTSGTYTPLQLTDPSLVTGYSKDRVLPVLLWLLDPRTHAAALHLLCELLCQCADEVVRISALELVGRSDAVLRQRKGILRRTAAHVLQGMLDVVSFGSKYPARCRGVQLAVAVMRSLVNVLRSSQLLRVRSSVQEIFKRSGAIAHLLYALIKCIKGCSGGSITGRGGHQQASSSTSNSSGREQAREENQNQSRVSEVSAASAVLRQGLALLTSIMAGHDGCKTEFGLICQHKVDSVPRRGTSAATTDTGSRSDAARDSQAQSAATRPTEDMQHSRSRSKSRSSISAHDSSSRSSSRKRGGKSGGGSSSNSSSSVSVKGFESIVALVLSAERRPQRETLMVLFELILDGALSYAEDVRSPHHRSARSATGAGTIIGGLFANDEDRPKIRNLLLVPELFYLLPYCAQDDQAFILQSFQNLIQGRASLVNLNSCGQTTPRVLELVLNLFPVLDESLHPLIVCLISTVGRHGISVSLLKQLFRLLQSHGVHRPAFSWRVVEVGPFLLSCLLQ